MKLGMVQMSMNERYIWRKKRPYLQLRRPEVYNY
jgi:hypothetical protein